MRFQKTAEGIYFGIMAPIYNVIPLTIEHFRDRFTDQRWLIYDSRRQYGYYYDGEMVNEITFTEPRQAHLITGILDDDLLAQDERLIQSMWKTISNPSASKSVSIRASIKRPARPLLEIPHRKALKSLFFRPKNATRKTTLRYGKNRLTLPHKISNATHTVLRAFTVTGKECIYLAEGCN